MKCYKGTDKDMKCRDMQYELGAPVEATGKIEVCRNGLHACESPLDVLRYYPLNNGNRYFEAEAEGDIAAHSDGSKIAASRMTLKTEIGVRGLIKAHFEYVHEKIDKGGNKKSGGDRSILAGGSGSILAGGDRSILAGGYRSILAGGNGSNLAGGDRSNLAGGDYSALAGGNGSNLAGGEGSLIVGRHESKAKGGMHSVLCLTKWKLEHENLVPVAVKAGIVDGVTLKPDTWYKLENGEFVEVSA